MPSSPCPRERPGLLEMNGPMGRFGNNRPWKEDVPKTPREGVRRPARTLFFSPEISMLRRRRFQDIRAFENRGDAEKDLERRPNEP